MSEFKEVIESVLEKQSHCALADSYYDGSVSEAWTTAFMSRRFGGSNLYKVNMAAVVVDAVNNRLAIDAVIGTSEKANKALNVILEQNEMALEEAEINKRTLIYGECYAIVWPDDDGDVEISYNSPATTKVFYSNENQRKKQFAVKVWTSKDAFGSESSRLNVYYADRIEKYRAPGKVNSSSKSWTLIDTVENPFGEIPVFHFRTHRPHGTPEHQRAYGAQDMINKLVRTHMETIDYQGAPQRYALTGAGTDNEADAFDEGDTDRENMDALRNGPGELWYLKGVNSVGQFAPADHKVFTEPLAVYTRAMASSTDTPMHYFERSANVPSGEALRTAEAPLLKKVSDRQASFGATWRDIYRFALKIEGIDSDVQIKWAPAESIDSLDAWEVATKKKLVGVSPYTIFVEMGYDTEIAQMMADAINEKTAETAQPGMNAHNVLAQESPDVTDAGIN